MRVVCVDQYHVVIFLFFDFMNGLDFSDKNDLEIYFRKLFPRLEESYGLELNGFLDIMIYIDDYYGCVIEIEKDDFDYVCDYSVEMSIHVVRGTILYQVNDPFVIADSILSKARLYRYRDCFYLELFDTLDKKDFYYLLEYSNVIYGNIVNNVVHYGCSIQIN